jgi:hypothetical protein
MKKGKLEQETIEQQRKLLTVVGVLPVIADLMEDIEFFQDVKRKANLFIESVRKADEKIMDGTNEKVASEQINIQLAFRNWMKENFN